MSPETTNDLPKAKTRKSKWNFSFIWVVPIVAALLAGYLIFTKVHETGSTIAIKFRDVDGLVPGQSHIQYRGAVIGDVTKIELDPDQQYATVSVRLQSFAESIARAQSVFWVVRPNLGMGNLTGLGTLITGPYIAVQPGAGAVTKKFEGVENSPLLLDPGGLKVVLLAEHTGSLRAGVPLYYRGIEVGAVEKTVLSTNARTVEIHSIIRRRYAPLVTTETKFWNVTGLDFHLGLFSGAEVNVESLKSLVVGGIAFATPPDAKAQPIAPGTMFKLYDKAEKEWPDWSPAIVIAPEEEADNQPAPATVTSAKGLPDALVPEQKVNSTK